MFIAAYSFEDCWSKEKVSKKVRLFFNFRWLNINDILRYDFRHRVV